MYAPSSREASDTPRIIEHPVPVYMLIRSLLAEPLSSLSVGADVQLGRVKLEIEGVEAQALLKVRLEHVRAILEKALDIVGEHPEILETLAQTLSEALREVLEDAHAELDNVLEGLEVGDTVDEVLKGRLEDIRTGLEQSLERPGDEDETRGALGEAGRTVRRRSGSEEAGEEKGEVQATPAAERRAMELGVDLSQVAGTGSGGRVTVRDVQNAAQAQ